MRIVRWQLPNSAIRPGLDVAMAVNSAVEYGPVARTKTAPWVHLLAEQEFAPSASFAQLTSAVLHVEARLLRARNLHHGDYSPDVHAAQFQIFFTVQNRNRKSQGHGDLLWFGVMASFMIALGLLTPPVGLSVYAAASAARFPVSEVFRPTTVFAVAAGLIVTAAMMIFPGLVTWLPSHIQ